MNPPTIHGEDLTKASEDRIPALIQDVAQQVIDGLREPPYYVVVRTTAPTEDYSLTMGICRLIANTLPHRKGTSAESRNKISLTKVMINPESANKVSKTTNYSRTNQPLTLHTDSSFKAAPQELVAFQMVRDDALGGDTIMLPIERILSRLKEEEVRTLARSIFPFSQKNLPVLWSNNGVPRIRYYRAQLENADMRTVPDEGKQALGRLDEILSEESIVDRFHLRAGETLFLNNLKVMHGRTGFAGSSDRLMYRARIYAGCLENPQ
ncbi:MAG: TauD/TfdA family dioxygenase [Pseudomonadota bacterium]